VSVTTSLTESTIWLFTVDIIYLPWR
jgi:hypothetical protein